MVFLLINAITGKRQESGSLPLLSLLLMMKSFGKGVKRVGRGHNKIDHVYKNFCFYSILQAT